jgi:hypothetical protein
MVGQAEQRCSANDLATCRNEKGIKRPSVVGEADCRRL